MSIQGFRLQVAPGAREELLALARQAVDENDDTTAAVDWLRDRMADRPDLWTALLQPFEDGALRAICRRETQTVRREAWTRPAAPDSRVQHLIGVNRANLLDFPLPGGKRLGRAGKAEIAVAAAAYERQGADMLLKARWLATIADRLPEGKVVADVFSDADLERLREDAR